MPMRRLGVFGENLPTKKERSVNPADFAIGGLYGQFGRKYDKVFRFRNTSEAALVLGAQVNPADYGWDCLNGFFANLRGQPGSIIVASYKGIGAARAEKEFGSASVTYTAITATTVNAETDVTAIEVTDSSEIAMGDCIRIGSVDTVVTAINDGTHITVALPVTTTAGGAISLGTATITPHFKALAAYQGEPEYGAMANRTGFTITKGAAFSATIQAITGDVVKLDSVAGIVEGDVISNSVNSALAHVLDVDELNSSITLSAAITAAVGDMLSVVAYQVKTFIKSMKGAVEEVETTMGKTWVTMNKNDPNRYLLNVFNSASSYLYFEEISDVPITGIADSPIVQYLAGGVDGVRPNSVSQFEAIWPMMDFQPMRICAACETSNVDIQKSLEIYCMNREDNPIVMYVGQMGMETKNQVLAAGQAFQRSSEVDAVFIHNWLIVPDPFVSGAIPIKRNIPNVGHTMGQWISSIGSAGIHSIPARKDMALQAVSGVIGYQALDDNDRTELAEAGANVIQQMTGRGVIVRNHFTPSTAPEFKYSNGLIMRNFIKVSVVDALQDSENTPNSMGRVISDRQAVLSFMYRMWASGSNGSVITGETFGQYMLEDGSLSGTDEAFEVIADASNNSVATLQQGERNIDTYFMFPAPAGSIRIGVGIIYRVA